MTETFSAYSRYYDLLYRDKDYAGEAEYVDRLIRRHHPGAASILDLGCGTGRHDHLLAAMGYRVTGVDRSEEMLAAAAGAASGPAPPEFLRGDVRTVRLGTTCDVVVALFHVMSYQTTNDDLARAFATVRTHLNPGGIFIFDCWYGPAVLTDRPAVRVKRLENEEIEVTRLAEPELFPEENRVDVAYHIFVRDKADGSVRELRECHPMRYLFTPEVRALAEGAGMTVIESAEWLTDRPPSFATWKVRYAVRG